MVVFRLTVPVPVLALALVGVMIGRPVGVTPVCDELCPLLLRAPLRGCSPPDDWEEDHRLVSNFEPVDAPLA